MTALQLQNVGKSFGKVEVLKNINLTVDEGEFVVFVGPSGCGKSTLLRVIAGLEDATTGTIQIAGHLVNDAPPAKRGIAMVFQSYALYPHLSVRGNMALGLKQAGEPKAVIAQRITEAARMLEMESYLDRRPAELSGGQRQRVAIGRAVVRQPKLFLFDEPLSNLDAALRMNTRIEIAGLHRSLDTTMVYVTHDQIEAMTLADRIVVMRAGRIEQVGAPMELYNDPANQFVASFLGAPSMNFLPGALFGKRAATLGIRPENLRVVDQRGLRGSITHVEKLGGDTNILATLTSGDSVTMRLFGQHGYKVGETVQIGFDDTDIYLFDADGARLRD